MPLSSFLGRRIWCQHAAFGACRRFFRRRNQPPACVRCEQLSAVFPYSCTARVLFLYGACLPLCLPYPQLTFTTSTHDTPNSRHSLQVLVGWWGQAVIFAIAVFADATGREWKRARGMALRKPCMAGMHGVGQGFQQTHSLHSFEDSNMGPAGCSGATCGWALSKGGLCMRSRERTAGEAPAAASAHVRHARGPGDSQSLTQGDAQQNAACQVRSLHPRHARHARICLNSRTHYILS
jgi:hypothetical protein